MTGSCQRPPKAISLPAIEKAIITSVWCLERKLFGWSPAELLFRLRTRTLRYDQDATPIEARLRVAIL
jgi:hypothetical protein